MSLIVKKFGGTSLSTENARESACEKIIQSIDKGDKVAVVVSAMGRKGHPYATDTLLSLINANLNKRDRDLLLSCGELISAVVMSDLLNSKDYKAQAVTGYQAGIMTNGKYGSSKCIYVNPHYLIKMIDENIDRKSVV